MNTFLAKYPVGATLFILALALSIPAGAAAEERAPRQFKCEFRVYQVLTNITGNGLTSQTLPGMNGWLQIIHEKLDDVELVMDGNTLTWSGQPTPDHPRIIEISQPACTMLEKEGAAIEIGSMDSPQYMTRKQDGLFQLEEMKPDSYGVHLSINAASTNEPSRIRSDFSFKYNWVKGREKIEGVNLEVGKPIIGHLSAEGAVEMRLGEWSCYQTHIESEGYIFLFIRATELRAETAPTASNAPAKPQSAGKEVGVTAPPAGDKSTGPKIEVGGSVEIRGNMISGGKK